MIPMLALVLAATAATAVHSVDTVGDTAGGDAAALPLSDIKVEKPSFGQEQGRRRTKATKACHRCIDEAVTGSFGMYNCEDRLDACRNEGEGCYCEDDRERKKRNLHDTKEEKLSFSQEQGRRRTNSARATKACHQIIDEDDSGYNCHRQSDSMGGSGAGSVCCV
jgi:hypothetical protein